MWYEQPTERQFRGSIVQLFSQGIRYGIATITRIQTDEGCDFIRRKDKTMGAWFGAAIGSVTLLWQGFDQYGTPFPKFLMDSDFFYGGVCWVVTLLFGWAAKAYHHVDHQ
jgi:hypothetical protein